MTSSSAELYASPSELRAQIDKTTTSGAATDANLNIIIAAVSRAIDDFCNWMDGFVALSTGTARVYSGTGKSYVFIDPCVSVSAVAVKNSVTDDTYESWTAADWVAFRGDPYDPNFNGLPYDGIMTAAGGDFSVFTSGELSFRPGFRPIQESRRGVPTVQVTAKWGYSVAVPSVIKQATLIESARVWKQGQSAHADVMGNAEMGILMYAKQIAPSTQLMLSRFIRPAVAGR